MARGGRLDAWGGRREREMNEGTGGGKKTKGRGRARRAIESFRKEGVEGG